MSVRAVVALATGLALVPAAVAATPAPARVQLSGDEFTLAVSRSSIRSGPAIIELVNYGEDDHDLAVRRVGGVRTHRTSIVHPGNVAELEVRLSAGTYTLWCTLADHRLRGMEATLVVR